MFAGVDPAERTLVDLRAELGEGRREERERGGEDEDDGEHDPERHRAEGRTGNEHHGGERDQHGRAGEEDGLACGVHGHGDSVDRLEVGAEEGAAVAVDDEERVVDPEREREHEREVHRPDRDLPDLRGDVERTGRGDQADDRQHQRQPGCDEGAEGEREDQERDRPGVELGLHHRVAVGGVEVGPHRGGAGQGDGDAVAAGGGELALEHVGDLHHRGRIAGGAGANDRGVTVL